MTMREFMEDRLGHYVVQAVFAVAAVLFLYHTGTAAGIIILLTCISTVLFVCGQAYEYAVCRARIKELESIMEGLDKKYLFAECVPRARSAYERRLMEFSVRAGRAMIRAVSDAEASGRQYREYVESWVHEIKTPITAAMLIGRNADSETRKKLMPELAQIEAHVERALYYARAESAEKDFIVAKTDLAEIAGQAVDNHRALFMYSGVRIEMNVTEQAVYTDVKWAAFIVGQLLQNAVRYRSMNPVISLSADRTEKCVRLIIRDNGIGIPAHELLRVYDRGFTGSNGRIRGGSTGMGLYLCRRLAACLEMELRIASQEGEGTEVEILFPGQPVSGC